MTRENMKTHTVLQPFYSARLNVRLEKGDTIEVSDDQALTLIEDGMIEAGGKEIEQTENTETVTKQAGNVANKMVGNDQTIQK